MELTESDCKPPNRSILTIDLNETPSSSETLPSPSSASPLSPTSMVRSFHDNHPPAEGPPADIPGEGWASSSCGACGRPEVRGHVVVCDGCERGFHFGCAGMRGRQAALLEEWVCGECLSGGVGSRRWPLGRKRGGGVRLLDMNLSPPSDGDGGEGAGDGEGSDELLMARDPRKRTLGANTFGGYPIGGPLSHPNTLCSRNGFGFQNTSAALRHTVRLDLEDIFPCGQSISRSLEDIKFSFYPGGLRSRSNTTNKFPPWDPKQIFLESLREFITERHGVLEEGWRVEFKQSKSSCELCAVYYAPDGKIFETMSDVACYLGLVSNGISVEPDLRSADGSTSLQKGLHAKKRRKLSRLLMANGFAENKGHMMTDSLEGLSSNARSAEFSMSKIGKNLVVTEAGKEDAGSVFQQFNDGLPIQYEDFFVLSLGKIDARPSYHNVSQIWPIGYRSCWHDKITGSIFLCDVIDDGDIGPLFKVRRFSCSSLPIPYGSTIFYRKSVGQLDCQKEKQSNDLTCPNMTYDGDCSIEMIFSDPCLPLDDVVLSWLGSSSNEACDEANPHQSPQNILYDNSPVGDKIGEFSVDGHSSSSVWRILSRTLIDACRQIYKQSGFLKFFCKHVENDGSSFYYDIAAENNGDTFSSLNKFCSLLGSINIPSVTRTDHEFESAAEVLENWIKLDRFGLDVEFVQEIIEHLPAVNGCSQYESLKSRDRCSTLPMVGNGLLLADGKNKLEAKQDMALSDGCKRGLTGMIENPAKDDRAPLPGKLLGSKLPPHLAGDVFQVWGLLWRFHEILGLEVAIPFDELEAELISPWYESTCGHERYERDQEDQFIISHGSGDLSAQASSSSSEFDRHNEFSHDFIEMENAAMREEACVRLASSTYTGCTGVVLRKAQISLLNVLVSELQLKVAALVDPTLDCGESKPRRGRRRDVASSSITRRSRLNMLPINEITWPELARRYVLAVSCMDGNLDSAEVTIRESGKILRCLQGDGGVLCGSLSGVAGIEADALFLAEALKRIYGSLNSDNDFLTIEEDEPDSTPASGRMGISDGCIPDWAQALEPVKKLPTNVGTRIRKCVYEALEKGPPEWAKTILEHSISKEVYKGNASGPTKKAVLSVLAELQSEGLHPKPSGERRKKTVLSISDIIMRKCRIVLRQATAADDDKVFCNLLGRNLNSSENDDEGLLGSPAMVPRPLDFRTVDFRLAVGSYGGSHEAFLEDVRELWSNVHTAHADEPDLVHLAKTLSQNFESLYEKEVVSTVRKLKDYLELDHVSAEARREIGDLLVSTSKIPKAPWDEGVCKVCGIDKDDDSVLLCDTCDAEYHTYCLNPPLARIPEGNWYCPSCVPGAIEGALKGHLVLGQRRGKKYHGEGIRSYLEELAYLAATMAEKEYWEFSVDERTLLLKVLCDELLTSVLVRQHLEQCAEMSTDLQQKLRSLCSEVKTLKVREDILITKAAKVGPSNLNTGGEASTEEEQFAVASNRSFGTGPKPALNSKSMHVGSISDDWLPAEGVQDEALAPGDLKRRLETDHLEKNSTSNGQVPMSANTSSQPVDADTVGDDHGASCGNHTYEKPQKRLKSLQTQESQLPSFASQEINNIDSETSSQVKMHEAKGSDVSSRTSEPLTGLVLLSEHGSIQVAECSPPLASNESHSFNLELNAVRKDLSSLQQSIADVESQVLKSSVRMEFLGSDSSGRLYWILAKPGERPWVIADSTIALLRKRQILDRSITVGNHSVLTNLAPSGTKGDLNLEGSNVPCPFIYKGDFSTITCSQWVSYQSDCEILELIQWLKDNDTKERELKDSITQWQKLRFQDSFQTGKQCQGEPLSQSRSTKNTDSLNCLLTKASAVLEKKYGPCLPVDMVDNLKKQWKSARLINDEKMHRCKCLEPIWPSRPHCLSCHRSYLTAAELDKHNDGRCSSATAASERTKKTDESSGGWALTKPETRCAVWSGETYMVEASKNAGSDLSSSLIKFQNEGLTSPYRFEDIRTKFVTNDSIKELMQGIGLIATDGVPSFLPSVPTYLDDPTTMLVILQDDVSNNQSKYSEKPVSLQGDDFATKPCIGSGSDNSTGRFAMKMLQDNLKADCSSLESQGLRDKKSLLNSCASSTEIDYCCTVPEASLRPLVGRAAQILRQLKICLLDMEAALPEEALRPSKVDSERRCAWRAFVKAATTIFEMIQSTIVLEDMMKMEYLRNEWWYWSSLSAAAKTSTLSALALRIYSMDNAIVYEKMPPNQNLTDSMKNNCDVDKHSLPTIDSSEKSKLGRRGVNKKRKDKDTNG
ncbi:hypothetical protein Nepgr_001178 [Nepenthes gracilis]|uniref:Methyl-CpG-binding domain-containing protein 9 n=1 Tax=Nepenthes gracilis TaxID=150966 RepID=A0AAD3P400_NEPGR|nr:hypothetical protein Nepgr_001178 [Nepenthes gracilis]